MTSKLKTPASIALLLAPVVALCSAPTASANPLGTAPPPQGAARYVPGELIVKFRAGSDAPDRRSALRRRDARVMRSLSIPRVRLLRIPRDADVQSAATALERDPAVAWAEPNSYQQGGSLPNDALFPRQWGLHNTGQTVQGAGGAAGDDINAPAAWQRTTGSRKVRVAVVDTGVNYHQPDLAPNVDLKDGWDFVQDDADPSDNNAHGTHVAGIIGARGNNGIGTAGVDWNVSIVPVRVLNNLRIGTCSDIADGLAYAARVGARVVNASLWAKVPCQAEEDAVAHASNSLFVFIAGNDGLDSDTSPTYPCSFPERNIVCVAATGQRDELADFSGYGAKSVDLAAPGVSIESAWLKWQPTRILYSDGFESPLAGRWVTGGTPDSWGRAMYTARNGSYSLADSPSGNYADNSFSYAKLIQGLDLSDEQDCAIRAWVQSSLLSGDLLVGDVFPDGVHSTEATVVSGSSAGFEKQLFDLAPLEGRSDGRFAFELRSDGSGIADGVHIDDLDVRCAPPVTNYTGAADEFQFDYGTSMAAPHVAGVAALVLSLDPSMSTSDLRARILDSVDPVPGLAGKLATGGRLDAARAVDLPPAARTGRASAVGSDHATISGVVNPRGGKTVVGFEIGRTKRYEFGVQGLATAPRGTSDLLVRTVVRNLRPATTYHYRLIARGPSRKGAVGADQSFTTARDRGVTIASALSRDLRSAQKALRRQRRHGLLRRGSFAASLHALAPGTFTVELHRRKLTIAAGTRTATNHGSVSLKARLTGRGRRLLRTARRVRTTLTLHFRPRSGAPITRSAAVALR